MSNCDRGLSCVRITCRVQQTRARSSAAATTKKTQTRAEANILKTRHSESAMPKQACANFRRTLHKLGQQFVNSSTASSVSKIAPKPRPNAHMTRLCDHSGSLSEWHSEPPLDAALSSLFCFFVLSACACSSEVTVTSYSPTSFVSRRGILIQTILLSRKPWQARQPGPQFKQFRIQHNLRLKSLN